jgi:hypothetical protein
LEGIHHVITISQNNPPSCPICSAGLKKWPSAKTICLTCKQPMLVRTHPWTKERVLCSETETADLDREWTLYRESGLSSLPSRINAERGALSLSQFEEKLRGDIRVQCLQRDMGLYYISRMLLNDVSALKGYGIEHLVEDLCLLHFFMNEPRNNGAIQAHTKLTKEYPDFMPDTDQDPPPALMARARYGFRVLCDDISYLKDQFIEAAYTMNKDTGAPLDPKISWAVLHPILKGQQKP